MNIEETLKEILKRLDKIEEQTKPVVSVVSQTVDWECTCNDMAIWPCSIHLTSVSSVGVLK